MQKRGPIVTVLGHIDHGKSTLLDTIQNTKITLQEIGGITQKISAYEIEYRGHKITFIDTPGHIFFDKLREKGAKVADIAILVIAGDEGVKPQTIESLEHIKKNNLPFIVAINKIDKPSSNPEKVKKELSDLGVLVEEWGGDVPCVHISALKGIGIDDLLEIILILSDLLDLKYDEKGNGEGYILEVQKDSKRGIMAGIISLNGKIELGKYIVTPSSLGKIKFMEDSFGKKLSVAYPSSPVLVGVFKEMPIAGEQFKLCEKEEIEKIKNELLAQESKFQKILLIGEGEFVLPLIIKADLIGSLEAIEKLLENLTQKEVSFKILKQDLGPLTIDDLNLAKEVGGVLLAFNVKSPKFILEEIKKNNLKYIETNLIYDLEKELLELIESQKEVKKSAGELEVLALFNQAPNKKTIGGKVILGKITLNSKVMIKRGEEIIGKGQIISLEKDRVPVKEVAENNLCGLIIKTNIDLQQGDLIVVEK